MLQALWCRIYLGFHILTALCKDRYPQYVPTALVGEIIEMTLIRDADDRPRDNDHRQQLGRSSGTLGKPLPQDGDVPWSR